MGVINGGEVQIGGILIQKSQILDMVQVVYSKVFVNYGLRSMVLPFHVEHPSIFWLNYLVEFSCEVIYNYRDICSFIHALCNKFKFQLPLHCSYLASINNLLKNNKPYP